MPVEHEILNVHKYKTIKKFGFFKAQISLEFSPLINVYEQEKVHAQLSWAWKKFYNHGAWIWRSALGVS